MGNGVFLWLLAGVGAHRRRAGGFEPRDSLAGPSGSGLAGLGWAALVGLSLITEGFLLQVCSAAQGQLLCWAHTAWL